MAIQQVDTSLPAGDTNKTAYTKINQNFTNTAHAASRLVGTATGNLMEVGAFGLGDTSSARYIDSTEDISSIPNGFYTLENGGHTGLVIKQAGATGKTKMAIFGVPADAAVSAPFYYQINTVYGTTIAALQSFRHTFWTTQNTTKDANGFIKAASPIVRVFADKIECNQDAAAQNIEYIKNGVGDYLIKNSSGLSNDGWYIETPKDANGNVLVAVVYKQLENGDISVKTYAKRFDDETGDIVPNLARPRDIPETRWIDLRLNDVEKDMPVMPAAGEPAK